MRLCNSLMVSFFFYLQEYRLSYILTKIEFCGYHSLSLIIDNFIGRNLHLVLNYTLITGKRKHFFHMRHCISFPCPVQFLLPTDILSWIIQDDLGRDSSQALPQVKWGLLLHFSDISMACRALVLCPHFQLHGDGSLHPALHGT